MCLSVTKAFKSGVIVYVPHTCYCNHVLVWLGHMAVDFGLSFEREYIKS